MCFSCAQREPRATRAPAAVDVKSGKVCFRALVVFTAEKAEAAGEKNKGDRRGKDLEEVGAGVSGERLSFEACYRALETYFIR